MDTVDGRGGAVRGYCGWKGRGSEGILWMEGGGAVRGYCGRGRGSEWILWMEGGGAVSGYCGWKGEGQ